LSTSLCVFLFFFLSPTKFLFLDPFPNFPTLAHKITKHVYQLIRLLLTIPNSTNRLVGRVAQWAQWLATGWTVRGSNPGGRKIFRNCPDRPWGPPKLLCNGYRVFHGGTKRPGRDADSSPTSSAEV
jgi:hypothetical protein